ncbi:MAG TPA: GNAT family N-acetyltransferase [Polyangiaceae bacterium]|nr:GNAT family N-acetyltransferase [Polyangiaceae bacterium]
MNFQNFVSAAGQRVSFALAGDTYRILVEGLGSIHFRVARERTEGHEPRSTARLFVLAKKSTSVPAEAALFRELARCYFEAEPGSSTVELTGDVDGAAKRELIRGGWAEEIALGVSVARARLYQCPSLWLVPPVREPFPLLYTVSNGKRHPARRPPIEGTFYRRHLPQLEASLSFRTLDFERDLPTFHRWMNEPRVHTFWELAGPLERHREYLANLAKDPHVCPIVGCFDEQPFGYFEVYWAKEDRLSPYYDAGDYDRGIHVLVGESRFRGPQRVGAWLSSLVHCLFLDDCRTRSVVAEPRADNSKMIRYFESVGFHERKRFDFPHKRAALMISHRETFFDQFCPGAVAPTETKQEFEQ